jgi:hypothetical protein
MSQLQLLPTPESQTRRGSTVDGSSDPVWILFIADIESRNKLLKYSSGSQWEVDPVTAAALILVGAAVRLPNPDAIADMTTDTAESA